LWPQVQEQIAAAVRAQYGPPSVTSEAEDRAGVQTALGDKSGGKRSSRGVGTGNGTGTGGPSRARGVQVPAGAGRPPRSGTGAPPPHRPASGACQGATYLGDGPLDGVVRELCRISGAGMLPGAFYGRLCDVLRVAEPSAGAGSGASSGATQTAPLVAGLDARAPSVRGTGERAQMDAEGCRSMWVHAVNAALAAVANLRTTLVVSDRATALSVIAHVSAARAGIVTCKVRAQSAQGRRRLSLRA
jgi:hypothetical protein